MSKWIKEATKIETMLNDGYTLEEVGKRFGVSKQRIGQVVTHLGIILNPSWGSSKRALESKEKERISYFNTNGFYPEDKFKYFTIEGKKISLLLSAAKQRAKERGTEFKIKLIDFYPYPKKCPVYDFDLDYVNGTQFDRWKSPSIDRLDNTKGYTKENTNIISWKANYVKSDSTIEDLEKVVSYLTKFTK